MVFVFTVHGPLSTVHYHPVNAMDLKALIDGAAWFSRCGQFPGEPGALPLSEVADSDGWDWLPTARDQPDPIHGTVLAEDADAAGLGPARRAAAETAERQVSLALRVVPDRVPALALGSRDFTPIAKAGAVFAVRAAALEVVAGRPSFWCRVVRLYAAGYWPCGLVQVGGQLVVL